ncbi:MAG TPA: DUF4185 domain-containing protein [Pirellulales bacterium]|nr:DUF4185 domain-containing protein [Pirellulales bacterium]
MVAAAVFYKPAVAVEPAPIQVVKAEPAADWNARFDGGEGWIGGDGVYSVLLAPRRVLFLFGDTLLGKVSEGRRKGAAMVNNTVGLLSLAGPQARLRFVSGPAIGGKPSAVFVPADGRGWFWPQAAIEVHDRLFVFLAHIDKTGKDGPFGFKQIGQCLATIDNPLDDPTAWRTEQRHLPFAEFHGERERWWGAALLAEGDDVYIYGIHDPCKQLGSKELIVARAPSDKIADFDAWRFQHGQRWVATPTGEGLADRFASEFSVSRLPDGTGYLVVYTESGLSDRILGRVSASPAGPWSEAVLLYTCPEMAGDKGVFCYAAKVHPWAARGNELLISYCVNAWEFGRLFDDNHVYRPRFVRVTLAAGPQADRPSHD